MRIIPELNVYREYIYQKKNTELFVSINQKYNIECNEKTVNTHFSTTMGTGVRFFNKDFVEFISCNGISKESIQQLNNRRMLATYFPKAEIASAEFGKFQGIDIDVEKETELSISEQTVRDVWALYAENSISQGEVLEQFLLQCQRDLYLIFTSSGIEGYSTRTVFAPGIKLLGNSCVSYTLYPEIIISDKEKMKHIVRIPNMKLPIVSENIQLKYILFSGSAACDLVYFLLMLLTEDMVLSGYSFIHSEDIGKKLFSSEFTIEENSEKNKLIVGSVDGEGYKRKPVKIVENGVLNTLFSGINNSLQLLSTGSAYRFSHTVVPQIRPSKAAVENRKSLQSVLSDYGEIIRIDSLTGLAQSFSPHTSEFTAFALATVIREGKPYYKRNIRIQTQIRDIFNEIISIADDEQYGIDGSVLSGSILVENKNFISMM